MKSICDEMVEQGYNGYTDQEVYMFNFIKQKGYGYVVSYLPGKERGLKERVWVVEITNKTGVVFTVEGTCLRDVNDKINHLLAQNSK